MKRPPNLVKLRHAALELHAIALASLVYWAENGGWPPTSGGALEDQPRTDAPSRLTHGRLRYSRTTRHALASPATALVSITLDVFSGEYRDALAHLATWERDAISSYLRRAPVGAWTKTEFERTNPERWDAPLAPLFLAPPDLRAPLYAPQLSAWLQLASFLGRPEITLEPLEPSDSTEGHPPQEQRHAQKSEDRHHRDTRAIEHPRRREKLG